MNNWGAALHPGTSVRTRAGRGRERGRVCAMCGGQESLANARTHAIANRMNRNTALPEGPYLKAAAQ
eukprot:6212910-Pleurochrysis_carterae.AAC.1